jgi:hypothetical protein
MINAASVRRSDSESTSINPVGDDVIGDVLRVPSDPAHQRRGQREQERQADEVQARLGPDDPA